MSVSNYLTGRRHIRIGEWLNIHPTFDNDLNDGDPVHELHLNHKLSKGGVRRPESLSRNGMNKKSSLLYMKELACTTISISLIQQWLLTSTLTLNEFRSVHH